MHLLVTRPQPDAETLAARLRSLGHAVSIEPMLEVRYLGGPIDVSGAQAAIVTSRNALRALSEAGQLLSLHDLRVYAVGQATAGEARNLGLEDVVVGEGTAEALCRRIVAELAPAQGALIHLAGADLAFDPRPPLEEAGFGVRQPVVYQTLERTALTRSTRDLLVQGALDGALFLSPRTAAVFVALIESEGLVETVSGMTGYCLSRNVAKPLAKLFGMSTRTCDNPSLDEMLALIGAGTAQ